MSTTDNGGPAFPSTEANGMNSGWPGMTLRDYFAAKAMQAIVHEAEAFWDKAAPLAYQYADEMMKAREA